MLTIFAKGIPKDNVSMEFGEQIVFTYFLKFNNLVNESTQLTWHNFSFGFQLSVVVDVPGEEPYRYQPRLFGKVIYFAWCFLTKLLLFFL